MPPVAVAVQPGRKLGMGVVRLRLEGFPDRSESPAQGSECLNTAGERLRNSDDRPPGRLSVDN